MRRILGSLLLLTCIGALYVVGAQLRVEKGQSTLPELNPPTAFDFDALLRDDVPEVAVIEAYHDAAVLAVAFSPDGRLVASGSADGTIILWDLLALGAVNHLKELEGSVTAVAFSPDGEVLAAADDTGTVGLWRLGEATRYDALSDHDEAVLALTISPGGDLLATGDRAGAIEIWDITTGQAVGSFSGFPNPVTSLAFSADGDVIHATASAGSGERLLWSWPVAGGDPEALFTVESERPARAPFRAAVYAPEHRRLAWAAGENLGYVALEKSTSVETLEGLSEEVTAVALSPDGDMIAAGSLDRQIMLWNGDTHEVVGRLRGHGQQIRALAFSADGQWLASGGSDRSLRIWEVARGAAHAVFGRPLLAGVDLWELEVLAARRVQKVGRWSANDGFDLLVVDLKLRNKLEEPTILYGAGLALYVGEQDSATLVGVGSTFIDEEDQYFRIHAEAGEVIEDSFIFILSEGARDLSLRLLDMAPISIE